MLRDDCVNLIALRIGNREDLAAAIVAEMQLAQALRMEEAGAFVPWFLETEMTTTVTTPGDERILLPSDFLIESEEQSLWRYDAAADQPLFEMKKDSYDVLVQKYPVPGIPVAYALSANYFLLKPTPDTEYTIKMRYYAKDTVLTSNIENKWLKYAPDLMIAVVGGVMATQYLQNQALAAIFQTEEAMARQRLWTKHEARQHVGRTYSMGEE